MAASAPDAGIAGHQHRTLICSRTFSSNCVGPGNTSGEPKTQTKGGRRRQVGVSREVGSRAHALDAATRTPCPAPNSPPEVTPRAGFGPRPSTSELLPSKNKGNRGSTPHPQSQIGPGRNTGLERLGHANTSVPRCGVWNLGARCMGFPLKNPQMSRGEEVPQKALVGCAWSLSVQCQTLGPTDPCWLPKRQARPLADTRTIAKPDQVS